MPAWAAALAVLVAAEAHGAPARAGVAGSATVAQPSGIGRTGIPLMPVERDLSASGSHRVTAAADSQGRPAVRARLRAVRIRIAALRAELAKISRGDPRGLSADSRADLVLRRQGLAFALANAERARTLLEGRLRR